MFFAVQHEKVTGVGEGRPRASPLDPTKGRRPLETHYLEYGEGAVHGPRTAPSPYSK